MIAYRPTIVLERLVNGMDALTVFLDSNEYKRCGHNFSSTPMRKIQELAEKETIYLLIRSRVSPLYIKVEEKQDYFDALETADTTGNYAPLFEVLFKVLLRSNAELSS